MTKDYYYYYYFYVVNFNFNFNFFPSSFNKKEIEREKERERKKGQPQNIHFPIFLFSYFSIFLFLLRFRRVNDVIDLEDHLNHLCRVEELLLLCRERLIDPLDLHIRGPHPRAVNAQRRLLLLELAGLDLGHSLNGREAAVLGEGEGDSLQGVGERADGVLLEPGDLVRLLGDGERAGELAGAAAVDDGAVADEVAGDAEGVVDAALGLLEDHLVAAADKDGHCLAVGAPLDHDGPVLGGAEGDLADGLCVAQLLGSDLTEARDDPSSSRNGDKL